MIWLWLTLALVVGVLGGLALVLVSLYAYMRRYPTVAHAVLATQPDLVAKLRQQVKRPLSPEAQRVVDDFANAGVIGHPAGLRLDPWQSQYLDTVVSAARQNGKNTAHRSVFHHTPRISLDRARQVLAEHRHPLPTLTDWLARCSSQAQLTSQERAALILMWEQRRDQVTPKPPTGTGGVGKPHSARRPSPSRGRGLRADRVWIDEAFERDWVDHATQGGLRNEQATSPPDANG